MQTKLTWIITAAVPLFALVACGGGGADRPKPKPVSHRMDDMHIARVPVTQKQSVVQAQNEYSVAKMEYAKTKADLEEADTKLRVAKNEREQTVLAEKSAREEKKAADKSADMNRVNRAMRQLRAAELERKAADEKVAYLKARRRALEEQLRYAEWNMYAKEATYELSKAKVAKKNNIRPKGFKYKVFEQQAQDRAQHTRNAKAVANEAHKKAGDKRKQWQSLLKEAQKARGGGSTAGGTGSP